jgi:hypothetical protein
MEIFFVRLHVVTFNPREFLFIALADRLVCAPVVTIE